MQAGKQIQVDFTFLQLIPSLDRVSLHLFPIDYKLINGWVQYAVQKVNTQATLGATLILFAKNICPNQKPNFPIIHDKQIDQILFMISQAGQDFKLQTLISLTRLKIQKIVSQLNKAKLKIYLSELKEFSNLFMKILLCPVEIKNQRLDYMKRLSKLVIQQKQQIKQHYEKVFHEHGIYIYKNSKELQLLKVILEIQYSTIEELNKMQSDNQQQAIYEFIILLKDNVYTMNRPSLSIEVTSFLLIKILLIRPQLSEYQHKNLMLNIEQIIDKNQITRLNLEQRTDLFAFHMKNNHYFYYLEQLFDPKIKSQYQLISIWKQKIRKAMHNYISIQKYKTGSNQIKQTIFYLQIRNRTEFLWNNSTSVNHFPEIQSNAVRRFMQNGIFKQYTTAEGFTSKLMSKFELKSLQQMYQMYQQFNIFEKAIFFYYMNNFEANFSLPKRLLLKDKEPLLLQQQKLINKFSNAELLQLLDFYINEIELGNYYRLQKPDKTYVENTVNQNIYRKLIEIVFIRLMSYLQQYKKIISTSDLTYISRFHKYLLLMIKGSCKKFPTPFMCKRCKLQTQSQFCEYCQGICVGIQLIYTNPSLQNHAKDFSSYQDKLNAVGKRIITVENEISKEMNNYANPWIHMLYYVIQSLIGA